MAEGAPRKAGKTFIICQENSKFKANTPSFCIMGFMKNCRTWNDDCCFIGRKCGTEIWNEIVEGTGLETVLSKGNRTGGSELIHVPLLQSWHSALRMWDQTAWWMAYWQSKEVRAAVKGVLKEEQFVYQTIWLARGWVSLWKGHCRKAEYGSTSQWRVQRQRCWPRDLLIWFYWISQKAHPCSLCILLCKKSWNRLRFPQLRWLWLLSKWSPKLMWVCMNNRGKFNQ